MRDVRNTFETQGYYLAKHVYDGDLLTAMTADFDRIVAQLITSGEDINARWNRAEPGTTVVHTHNVQQYSAVWLRALLHEPFLDIARAILGPGHRPSPHKAVPEVCRGRRVFPHAPGLELLSDGEGHHDRRSSSPHAGYRRDGVLSGVSRVSQARAFAELVGRYGQRRDA
jgi:hypothetical protein